MSETVEATETSNNTTEVKATSSAQAQLTEEELKKQTDCYFYLHNGCNKGDKCEFRHSEAALNTQTVCRDWVLDNCPRGADCPSRHPSKQTATTFKPKPYFKPGYSAPYHAPHYPTYHQAPQVDRSQTPCYYFLMGQCTKGAACPFSHQFVRAEDANKKSTDDTDKNLKFNVKNDSASEERSNNRNNNGRDESSNRSRDRDENSRHSDDGGRQRRSRQEANVVFELPNNSRKHEQRARSNSDVKHNNNNNSNNNNNKGRDQNNNKNRDQPINRKQGRQDRDSVNSTAVSFAASKEERQKLREQERAKAESGQKASFGVQRLSSLLPGQEESVGSKRSRDSAEESPNKRRKVENSAPASKDDLDRELDELNLPPPANDDEELLDI